MKKLSIFISLLAVALSVNAQSNFLLYSFKGNVLVVENGTESKAKVGKMLNSNATVKVAAGGAATLICNEAAMFTITKAGTYALNKFGDSCKVSSSSVSANYVKYVWASMTKDAGSPGSNRKAFMNTVGAVRRSVYPVYIDPKLDTVNYTGGEFPLSWTCYCETKTYNFALFEKEDLTKPFYTAVISKQKIPITDFSAKLTPGKSYFWTCSMPETDENEDLKVLNYVSKEAFEEVLNKFKSQGLSFEAPAEQAYRTGFMLEDAHFLAEAYQYYSKAVSLDKENVLYLSTLMSFKKDYEIK
ncbi:MAG: hypothetical protein HOP10_08335 [Chitinophagaceae bacterium]|nr:hypothetical protein [Chitinophagaceae bacterium]